MHAGSVDLPKDPGSVRAGALRNILDLTNGFAVPSAKPLRR